jgi:Trk-type K+ transport system membrane component
MKRIGAVAAILGLAIATSTKEGRHEARDRLKPHNRILGIIAFLLWLPFIIGAAIEWLT